jgi:hypothetical protein
MGYTRERPDLSEFDGEAVVCESCDAIVPLAKWNKRTPLDARNPVATEAGLSPQGKASLLKFSGS